MHPVHVFLIDRARFALMASGCLDSGSCALNLGQSPQNAVSGLGGEVPEESGSMTSKVSKLFPQASERQVDTDVGLSLHFASGCQCQTVSC